MDFNNTFGNFEEFVVDVKSENILNDVTIEISEVRVQEQFNENISEFETVCDAVNSENPLIECVQDVKPVQQYFERNVTDVDMEISQLENEESNLIDKISDLIKSDTVLPEQINKREVISSPKLKKKKFKYRIFHVNDPNLYNSEFPNKINYDTNPVSTLRYNDTSHNDLKITRVFFPKKNSVKKSFSEVPEGHVESEEKVDSTSICIESGYISETDSTSQSNLIPNTLNSTNDFFYGFDNGPSTSGLRNIKRENCDSNMDISTRNSFEDTENVSVETSQENRELSLSPDIHIKRPKMKSKMTRRDQEKADLMFARELHGTINRHHLKRTKSQRQSYLQDF